jgi:hypothetical protein
MVAIIGVVYYLSRHSAKVELALSEELFPAGHMPKHWIVPTDPVGITISVIFFFALYVGLAWMSDRIRIVSGLMLAIACIDFNTRRLINVRVDTYFNQYEPHPEDDDYKLIRERREVIRKYLHKPHLWKESARAGGCAVAFAVAMSGSRSVAYLILMATLIVNEIVTWKWRAERDRAFRPLLGEGEAAEDGKRQARRPKSFSIITWLASVLYMVLAAYVARKEGVYTSRSVTIGFINHGGMWGDFLVLPLVNGLIVPCVPRITAKRAIIGCGFLACAAIIAFFAHEHWAAIGKATGTTDFVFPSHSSGAWYNDLSISGYMHMVYMSVELSLLLAYAVVSMPVPKILWISGLLTTHVILGQVQPSWYSTGTIWNARTMVPTVTTVLLTWLVGLYKIRHERRRGNVPAKI